MIHKSENLVVTRPLNQADSLIKSLNHCIDTLIDPSEKIVVTHLPLIQINKVDVTSSINLSGLDGIIFISPNAVTYAVSQLSEEAWKELISKPLFAVGSRTEETLKKHCKQSVIQTPAQMNTEGLLEMPDLCSVSTQNWLIVKGVGGRDKLKKTLSKRGASIQELCTYERVLPNKRTIENIGLMVKNKTAWIISSVQAVNHFYQILNQIYSTELELAEVILNCRLIVSSDRIRESATKLGLIVIAVAKDATDKQLLNCIRELNYEG